MTQIEILEGNTLIAEFMGAVFHNDDIEAYPNGYWLHDEMPFMEAEDFTFHESWQWMMDVVEKIESIHSLSEGFYINIRISQGYVEIEGVPRHKIFFNTSVEGSKIVATYKAVVEFIKHYQKIKLWPITI